MGKGTKNHKKRRSKLVKSDYHQSAADPDKSQSEIVHCVCGTGCVDCYGKINCGCPDCVTPVKVCIKLPTLKWANVLTIEDLAEYIEDLFINRGTYIQVPILICQDTSDRAIVDVVQTKIDDLLRPAVLIRRNPRPISIVEPVVNARRNRLSLPVLSDFYLPKTKEITSPSKPPFTARNCKPIKQTKFYCKQCKTDICNACFTSFCAGHNVQWIGQATFLCQARLHTF
ncbi:uncharacterized protein LOC111715423 isoform X1 [Eurytemora carolleeae]|uniref:uncharacterized protein LOC111715423 isoform X1 n=1 Tax=Eurytemora carolleeae TaxID=1294199 RepID=UPI000C774144|nr:uncharacterized protein LOC111715423 isoform X1 [Eurytemora carolleeae]|eukprot:XP_023346506.1 uncharacterized protein LOC111715423 isoform X1 [Eurytemora affinis]